MSSLSYVEHLIRLKYLGQLEAKTVIAQAEAQRLSIVQYLLSTRRLTPRIIAESLSTLFDAPLFDLDALDWRGQQHLCQKVGAKKLRELQVLPLQQGERELYVAIADPDHLPSVEQLSFYFNKIARILVVEEDKLRLMLNNIEQFFEYVDVTTTLFALEPDQILKPQQLKLLIQQLMSSALIRNAHFIYFKPTDGDYQISYRMDSQDEVRPWTTVSPFIAKQIMVALKTASVQVIELNHQYRGYFPFEWLSQKIYIDFFQGFLKEQPHFIIHLQQRRTLLINRPNWHQQDRDRISQVLGQKGLMVITGVEPFSTLESYRTLLQILKQRHINLFSLENPPTFFELEINNIWVDQNSGVQFADYLKQLQYSQPDAVAVSDLGRRETLIEAVHMAQRDVLVIGVLSEVSVVEAIAYLLDAGMPPQQIQNVLKLVIAEKSVPQLCLHCKQPVEVTLETLTQAGFSYSVPPDSQPGEAVTLYQAVGCEHCQQSGYLGKTNLQQVLSMTLHLKEYLQPGVDRQTFLEYVQTHPLVDYKRSALESLLKGEISLNDAVSAAT